MTQTPIQTEIDELVEEFDLLGDWEQRYRYLIDMGKALPALDDDEKGEFLESAGLEEPGLDRLIRIAYGHLDLITYFTASEKECRAWTIRRGTLAPGAAGVIHTDFERGFIRAEVVHWSTLIDHGSEAAVKAKGQLRVEGKDYEVKDGDVLHFRFNV